MWSFPASFMAEFFDNHGMYSLRGRPRWRTVRGGSQRYVEAIAAPWRERLRLSAPVRRIERLPDRVLVAADGCETEDFDEVVIATHSDQALRDARRPQRGRAGDPRGDPLPAKRGRPPHRHLADAAPAAGLGELELPPDPEPAVGTTVTYWMNNLQRLEADREFLVTLNRSRRDRP